MKTSFKLLDNKPVWEISTTEGRSQVFRWVAVNARFIREAKATGDRKFIEQTERILQMAKDARGEVFEI